MWENTGFRMWRNSGFSQFQSWLRKFRAWVLQHTGAVLHCYLFQPGSVRLLSLQHTCSRWAQDMLSLGWAPSRTPSEGTWVLQMV